MAKLTGKLGLDEQNDRTSRETPGKLVLEPLERPSSAFGLRCWLAERATTNCDDDDKTTNKRATAAVKLTRRNIFSVVEGKGFLGRFKLILS